MADGAGAAHPRHRQPAGSAVGGKFGAWVGEVRGKHSGDGPCGLGVGVPGAGPRGICSGSSPRSGPCAQQAVFRGHWGLMLQAKVGKGRPPCLKLPPERVALVSATGLTNLSTVQVAACTRRRAHTHSTAVLLLRGALTKDAEHLLVNSTLRGSHINQDAGQPRSHPSCGSVVTLLRNTTSQGQAPRPSGRVQTPSCYPRDLTGKSTNIPNRTTSKKRG